MQIFSLLRLPNLTRGTKSILHQTLPKIQIFSSIRYSKYTIRVHTSHLSNSMWMSKRDGCVKFGLDFVLERCSWPQNFSGPFCRNNWQHFVQSDNNRKLLFAEVAFFTITFLREFLWGCSHIISAMSSQKMVVADLGVGWGGQIIFNWWSLRVPNFWGETQFKQI